MVDSGGITELASQSLELVGQELGRTLESARAEIEDYVEGQADGEALIRAASMLHLAAGAMKLVEIHGAAMLAEQMEEVCRSLTEDGDEESVERSVGALTRAMVELPAYLDRLLAGGGDIALVLLPILNELRQVRGLQPMSEGTLLMLSSGPFERPAGHAADPTASGFGPGLARLAQSLRPRFQTSLLAWIRGADDRQSLATLVSICDRLAEAAGSAAATEFWTVVSGMLTAIGSGGLEASVTVKRLIGQADRQLKRLIDAGEDEFAANPPKELENSLLYYIARAKTEAPQVLAIREQFQLADLVPNEAEIERARENLSGPSIRLMQTVALAISEDLVAVKDALDIFVRTGMEDASDLSAQVELLRKIGDTLGVLGLDQAQSQIHREADGLDAALTEGDIRTSGVLERTAAALLDVEDTLGQELVRIAAPQDHAGDEPAEEDDSTHYRHVTQAVFSECIVNLAKIKEVVVRVVEDPSSVRVLDQIGPQLRGITAGLLMLNKTRAVRVVERIGQVVTTRLTHQGRILQQAHLERLADAIVSVEYYLETLGVGRADPWYMLDNAQRCLDLLERLPGDPAMSRTVEAGATDAAAEGVPMGEARDIATSTVDVDVGEDVQPEAPAGMPDPDAGSAETKPLSVMEVDEDRSEPELVEIFIEEAREEIANVAKLLPVWTADTSQTDALGAVRRSFHTLKGSGRMVGAQRIGEYAWGVENLLNRVINQTLSPTPEILEFVGGTVDTLKPLLEELEIGTPPTLDVERLIATADALASGEPAAAAAAVESDAGGSIDPVLSEIFSREVRTHLKTLRDYASGIDAGVPLPAVDDTVYRASHTLLGSARMANVPAAMAVAAPLERLLGRLHENSAAPSVDLAGLIVRAAAEFERLAQALDTDAPFEPDTGIVAELEVAAEAPLMTAELDAALAEIDASEGDASAASASASGDAAPAVEPVVSAGAPASVDDSAPQDPAFDPDIAAIFAAEASELLEAAETVLQQLGSGVDPDAGLRDLQRQLHTIKGGARMAGIAAMGDLSHALESLLVGLVERGVEFSPPVFGLIRQSVDRLQLMRDAVDAGQAAEPAPNLVERVEAAARGALPEPAAAGPEPEVVAPGPGLEDVLPSPGERISVESATGDGAVDIVGPTDGEAVDDARVADERGPQAGEVPATASDVPTEPGVRTEPDVETGPVGTEPDAAATPRFASDEAARQARPVDKVDTARVNADLLDELLNQAGEISIFQSRLAQQMQSIEFHLGELGQTVTRLREQLRSLETETEAQILHVHQDAEGQSDFDPLELDRYSTIQQLSRALAETSSDVASINELLGGLTSETGTLLTQQTRVTSDLQDGLMHTRMVPMSRQVPRLGRIVRQAAADTGKQAELEVQGAESQLDRQVLESIMPALEHILRNAVAHGIETPEERSAAGKPEAGAVLLNVRRDGAEVIIVVSDDGAGLDTDAIRRRALEQGLVTDPSKISDDEAIDLILRPGFSTAATLTQAAGRGVGMDVVDNEVKKLGGSMRIETERGRGARFVIRLPFTLAITHALIVRVGEETFAVPLPTVEGITRVRREQLLEILTRDEPILSYGDVNYRVQHLGSLVGGAPSALPEDDSAVSLVLVRAGDNSAALLTDSLEGSREIVVKTLGPHLASIGGVSGATILGDGRVCIILDAPTLVRAGADSPEEPAAAVEPVERQLAALVVDDSITMRRVTQRLLERRGMRVLTARDGLDAIEVLQEHEADIIVLDIEMPRMDGYQFASHVRNDAVLKDTPIIMVTSRSGEKHRAKAIELGVNDYLSKPYQEAQLIDAVQSLLGTEL